MPSLLRFIAAGSVDDGKSTLIGRLLHDNGGVYEDQVDAVRKASAGSSNGLDFAYITDGLRAEREQGITIDVAYRHFRTARRRFIIADAPGHEQYTRNMATGASTADLAIILIDARKGVQVQSRRHVFIASLLGIRNFVIAVNKMDLVGYNPQVFNTIRQQVEKWHHSPGLDSYYVPVSALGGDNVTTASVNMPWFDGPALLEYLENVEIAQAQENGALRLPVQYVIRSGDGFRGYAGRLAGGSIRPGDPVYVWPSNKKSAIAEIVAPTGPRPEAASRECVTVRLADDLDVGRGDMLCDPGVPPIASRNFRASLIWMADTPLHSDAPYLLKHTTRQVCASVRRIAHRIDIASLQPVPSQELRLNDIAEVDIETHQPLYFDPYRTNRFTGSFVLIDMMSNQTVGAGMIRESLHEEGPSISSKQTLAHPGLTVWFTGLSGAGKSTISQAVEAELVARGYKTESLDGDVVRKYLSRGLGFSREDRDENIRRIGFVAGLLTRNNVIALVAAISPYRAVRKEVESTIERVIEVFVNAPLEICEQRDPKGLYAKARRGELHGFTGVDDPYEPPENPDVECRTGEETVEQSAAKVLRAIYRFLGS